MTARPRVVAVAVLAALLGGVSALPAAARAVPGCRSYPKPGTTSAAAVPWSLRAEYGVLRRAQRPRDRVTARRLGSLPESGILMGGIRLLGRAAYGGRAFMVPALHLLSAPMAPVGCVAPAKRALEQALLPSLRSEYATRGLCLVIVYKVRSTPACQSAAGSMTSLLYGPGTPGLGIVPDGVPAVRLTFRAHAPIRARVHNNFWIVVDPKLLTPPCGLDWIDRRGIALRTIVSCNSSTDTD